MNITYNNTESIACCKNNNGRVWIEMHKNLKKYPKLHRKVLEHEMVHYNNKCKFNLKDLWHDFKGNFDIPFQLSIFLFALRNKCFHKFIPEPIDGKHYINYYDSIISMIIVILVTLILLGV